MRALRGCLVTLEPQVAAHADELYDLLCDPELYTFLDQDPPGSLEWLRERFRKLESRESRDAREKWLNWVIRTQAGEAIGFVQASVRNADADIAFVVARGHWGQGLAYDAAEAMIAELAEGYGVSRLFATAAWDNRRSIKLLKRLGFRTMEPAVHPHREVAPGDVLMAMRPGEDLP